MRAACRHCHLHHTKRNFSPLKAPGRRAPISSRIPVTRVMRMAAPSNQATQPAFTSQTCGSLAPPIGIAYTSWLLGVKQESEGPAPLESSSVTRPPVGCDKVRRSIQGSSGAPLSQLPSIALRNSPLPPPPGCNDLRPARAKGDVHEKI